MRRSISIARTCAVLLVAAAAIVPLRGQTVELRPGKYQTTLERSAMGHTLAPLKNEECVTADDVKALKDFAIRLAGADEECSISDYRETRGRVSFRSSCDHDDEQTVSQVELTHTADSFRMVVRSTFDEGESMMTLTSRRTGSCD
jgi:hypothetical protein